MTMPAINHPSTEAPFGLSTQLNFDSTHSSSLDGVVSEYVEPDSEEDGDNVVLPRIGFDYNTSGGEEDDQPDNRNRTRIRPIGNSFEDSRVVLGTAYSDMRAHYAGSWTCWSQVPEYEKNFWWTEFEGRYFWKDKHSAQVKANWGLKCSQYLRSTFFESRPSRKRPTYKRPNFVDPDKWLEMKEDFESEDFKQRSETNKRNRASEARDGSAMYTGGSKSSAQHVADYEKEHGKPMSMEKLMEKTYRKKDGTWAGKRAQIVLKRNKELHDKFVEQHPEGMTQQDVDKLWLQAVGGKGKSSVFGGGALYKEEDRGGGSKINGS